MKIPSRATEHKRTFDLLKLSLFVNVVLLIAFAGNLVFMVSYLYPAQKTKHVFLQVSDRSEQVVKVLPIETNKEGIKVLTEHYIRQYIEDRETLDLHTEKSRFLRVKKFHSRSVDDAFMKLMNKDNKSSPIRVFRERNMIRQVEVLNTWDLHERGVPNTYQIDWKAIDSDRQTGEIKQTRKFRTMATAVLDEKFKKYIKQKHKDDNPIGLTIIKYTVKPLKGEDSNAN